MESRFLELLMLLRAQTDRDLYRVLGRLLLRLCGCLLYGRIFLGGGAPVYRTAIRSNVIIKEAQAAQENVFDYIERKAQTPGERVSESSRNFVNDCLEFVKEFVEKERGEL